MTPSEPEPQTNYESQTKTKNIEILIVRISKYFFKFDVRTSIPISGSHIKVWSYVRTCIGLKLVIGLIGTFIYMSIYMYICIRVGNNRAPVLI